jgi:tRNA threonylcarbamoyl adenosine modification protein YeaZ
VLLLVVDTSTPTVLAGLVELDSGGLPTLIGDHVTVDARRHGELLTPAIEALLVQTSVTPGDLDAVIAGVGPGPYTGLRVGLVTALALSDALGLPRYGVCSLDGLAHPTPDDQRLLVATDARRREIYWATYNADGTRRTRPAVSRPADVDTTGCDLACGAGALLYADVLGLPVVDPAYPQAVRLAAVAAPRAIDHAPPEPLVPLYLRRPDAALPGPPKAVLR